MISWAVASVLVGGLTGVWTGADGKAVDLNQVVKKAVAAAKQEFSDEKLGEDDIAVTLHAIDRDKGIVAKGSVNGDLMIYPASVVKAFYLAYAAHLLDDGDLKMTPELERAVGDMIRSSNNDATGYVLDLVCGTTPGPELGEAELAEFGEKRRAVNRWFDGLGYTGVNAVQRTYNEGPYGREAQWVGEKFENRNMLSTDACARLMTDIALGKHWSEKWTKWMHELLSRGIPADGSDQADGQSKGYTGKILPKGSKLYSKAGWTSTVRHDMAWVVMPDGREFSLAIFTKRGSNMRMVSFVAAMVFEELGYEVGDSSEDLELGSAR